MASYTPAYSAFIVNLGEVDILLRYSRKMESRDPVNKRSEINALCRAAVVLLSAHLEAFIRDLGELALDSMHKKNVPRAKIASRFYYHISKQIISEIKDTSDHDKIAEKVFTFIQNDLPYWSRIASFPQPISADQFNKGFSNPAYEKIKSYLNRFGYGDFSRDLATKLKAKYQPAKNMVDHLVDTRNKIAHGDTRAKKTPSEIQEMVGVIRLFCMATDSVFATWWRKNCCAIR